MKNKLCLDSDFLKEGPFVCFNNRNVNKILAELAIAALWDLNCHCAVLSNAVLFSRKTNLVMILKNPVAYWSSWCHAMQLPILFMADVLNYCRHSFSVMPLCLGINSTLWTSDTNRICHPTHFTFQLSVKCPSSIDPHISFSPCPHNCRNSTSLLAR